MVEKASAAGQNPRQLDHRARLKPPSILHDIRRSTATGLATLAVQPHIIEAVLGHVSGFGPEWPAATTSQHTKLRNTLHSICGASTSAGLVADPQMSARKAVDI